MMELTPEGRRVVDELAQRHGVSSDAVLTLLRAVAAGNGTSAQFSHPELGGTGQWSQGGMIMVGDMFNNALKHRVDVLCSELAALVRNQPLLAAAPSQSQSQSQSSGLPRQGIQGQIQGGPGGHPGVSLFVPAAGPSFGAWWPAELGAPASTGAQNDIRYACFPAARRLAIQIDGRVTVYDTLDHQISGFSQQQSGDASLTFTSQHGLVRVADLPVVPTGSAGPPPSRAEAVTPDPCRPPASGRPWPPQRSEPRRPSPPPTRRWSDRLCRRDLRPDRAPRRAAAERHPHRGGVRHQEGRAARPPLTRASPRASVWCW